MKINRQIITYVSDKTDLKTDVSLIQFFPISKYHWDRNLKKLCWGLLTYLCYTSEYLPVAVSKKVCVLNIGFASTIYFLFYIYTIIMCFICVFLVLLFSSRDLQTGLLVPSSLLTRSRILTPFNDQVSTCMEISQLLCSANQLLCK